MNPALHLVYIAALFVIAVRLSIPPGMTVGMAFRVWSLVMSMPPETRRFYQENCAPGAPYNGGNS